MKKEFILGYAEDETPITPSGENLTLYNTRTEAAENAVEWLVIEANSEIEARCLFEGNWELYTTK